MTQVFEFCLLNYFKYYKNGNNYSSFKLKIALKREKKTKIYL